MEEKKEKVKDERVNRSFYAVCNQPIQPANHTSYNVQQRLVRHRLVYDGFVSAEQIVCNLCVKFLLVVVSLVRVLVAYHTIYCNATEPLLTPDGSVA